MQSLNMEGYVHIIYIEPKLKKEIYLQAIKNRDVRKCFTQFRISAHQLAIGRVRYRNIKADEEFVTFVRLKKWKMKCTF